MRRILLFCILFLVLTGRAMSQTGMTAPIFGQDQCLWIETENGSVVNNFCGKLIVPTGSLTNNGDGTFTLSFTSQFSEGDAILLEGGDYLLLENGDKLLIEI